MAEFHEKLIFDLSVNVGTLAADLKKAVNSAVSNLRPKVVVRAADIIFQGKVKAKDLFDLTSLAAGVRDAVQAGLAGVRGGLGSGAGGGAGGKGGGLLDPRARDGGVRSLKPPQATAEKAARTVEMIKQEEAATKKSIDNQISYWRKFYKEKERMAGAYKFPAGPSRNELLAGKDTSKFPIGPSRNELLAGKDTSKFPIGPSRNELLAGKDTSKFPMGPNLLGKFKQEEDAAKQSIENQINYWKAFYKDKEAMSKKFMASVIAMEKEAAKRTGGKGASKFPIGPQLPASLNINASGFIADLNRINVSVKASGGIFGMLKQKLIDVAANGFNKLSVSSQAAIMPLRVISTSIGILAGPILSAASGGFMRLGAGIARMASIARTAISPVTSLIGTLSKSVAILTGSGLLFGGATFIPVAGIRAATSAFKELAAFTDTVSLSVTQFSGEIAGLQGADRIAYIDSKFRDLGNTIQDTSVAFGLSSEAVGKGLFDILSAQVGVTSVSERLSALNTAARVAVGGVTDLDSAFKGLLSINRVFGLSFEQSADQLFAIQKFSPATVRELSPQLGRVASIAADAGVKIQELGAAISTVTATSVPLETTITGLRQVFAELASGGGKSTRKLVEEIKAATNVDLKFDINAIRSGGLEKFLETLNKIRDINPEMIGRLFPDTRSISVILPLLDSMQRFSKNLTGQFNAQGEAAAAEEVRLRTLATSFNRLQAAISGTVVNIAQNIANLINLKGVTDSVVQSLKDFSASIRGVSVFDLSKILKDIASIKTRGIQSIIDFIQRGFFRAADYIVVPIARAFTFIYEAGTGIFAELWKYIKIGINETASFMLDTFSKAIRGSIIDPFGSGANAMDSKRMQLTLDSSNITKQLKGIGVILDEALSTAGNDDAIDGLTKKLRSGLKGASDSFSASLLNGTKTLEERLAGISSSARALKIKDNARQLGEALSRKPDSGSDFFRKGFGNEIERTLRESQASDIAGSILGDAFKPDEAIANIKKLTQALNVDLYSGFGFQVPDFQTDIISKVAQLKRQLSREEYNLSVLGQGSSYTESRNFTKQKIDAISASIAQLHRESGALPEGFFKALNIGNAGTDIKSQFLAISDEFDKISRLAESGTVINDKYASFITQLRQLFALKIQAVDPQFLDMDKTNTVLVSQFSEIKDTVRKLSGSIYNDAFKVVSFGGLKIPMRVDITRKDRTALQGRLAELTSLINDTLASDKMQNAEGPFKVIQQQLMATLTKVGMLSEKILGIKDAWNEGLDPGDGFDKVTFFVQDSQASFEAWSRTIKNTFQSVGQATDEVRKAFEAMAAAMKSVDPSRVGAGALEAMKVVMANASGGTTITSDNRHTTLNVVPRDAGIYLGRHLKGYGYAKENKVK